MYLSKLYELLQSYKNESFHSCGGEQAIRPLSSLIKSALGTLDVINIKPKDLMEFLRRDTGLVLKYTTSYKAIKMEKLDKNLILEDYYSYLIV